MSAESQEIVIPAGHARAWRMRAGERVTIAQTEGHQVGDFIAFNAADLTEFLSTSHTRRCLNRYMIGRGHALFTNHREPIVEIVEDTVGVHDIMAAACDPYRYRRDFRVENHRSCRMNFVEALVEHDIADWRVPDPVNLFQNSGPQPDGRLVVGTAVSLPGQFVSFLALRDLVVVLTACSVDYPPLNNGRCSPLRIEVTPPGQGHLTSPA